MFHDNWVIQTNKPFNSFLFHDKYPCNPSMVSIHVNGNTFEVYYYYYFYHSLLSYSTKKVFHYFWICFFHFHMCASTNYQCNRNRIYTVHQILFFQLIRMVDYLLCLWLMLVKTVFSQSMLLTNLNQPKWTQTRKIEKNLSTISCK